MKGKNEKKNNNQTKNPVVSKSQRQENDKVVKTKNDSALKTSTAKDVNSTPISTCNQHSTINPIIASTLISSANTSSPTTIINPLVANKRADINIYLELYQHINTGDTEKAIELCRAILEVETENAKVAELLEVLSNEVNPMETEDIQETMNPKMVSNEDGEFFYNFSEDEEELYN